MRKLLVGYKAWRAHNRLSEGMTRTDLLYAYFSFPSIQLNVVLAAAALALALWLPHHPALLLLIFVLGIGVYSIVEYVFHRYVLHARAFYRHKATAAFWKRVHYDHHRDTSDLSVLFGDPRTTLPPILIIATPLGWIIHGPAGAAAAVFTGLVMTSFYEFCHLYQHVPWEPRSAYLRRLKRRHLAHHFHNETGNFGVTTPFWDIVFKTNYESNRERPRSASTRTLGYTGEETERFPWVRQLTETSERH